MKPVKAYTTQQQTHHIYQGTTICDTRRAEFDFQLRRQRQYSWQEVIAACDSQAIKAQQSLG